MPQPLGPIEAVIFDLDGVLIQSEALWHRAEIEVFTAVGVPLTTAMCIETTGVRIDAVVRLWHQRYPWSEPALDVVEARVVQAVVRLIEAFGQPMPHALEAVQAARARGCRVGVASSSPRVIIDAALKRLGIQSAFDTVRSAEALAQGKPHPEVYLLACADVGVDPARAVAVEDSSSGIRAAVAAGMRCVAVPDPAGHRPPDEVLALAAAQRKDLRDFAQVLRDLAGDDA